MKVIQQNIGMPQVWDAPFSIVASSVGRQIKPTYDSLLDLGMPAAMRQLLSQMEAGPADKGGDQDRK
jgi:hypothetical protein